MRASSDSLVRGLDQRLHYSHDGPPWYPYLSPLLSKQDTGPARASNIDIPRGGY